MHAIRTQNPPAPIEEALKTPAFSPVLTALEWCSCACGFHQGNRWT